MMFCLAGVGGRVPGIMETTRSSGGILAMDGCPVNCVKACLEQAGFESFEHLQLADLGMAKGQTDVNDANIATVARAGASMLG
jgi:uncharacterized metal-binding protein